MGNCACCPCCRVARPFVCTRSVVSVGRNGLQVVHCAQKRAVGATAQPAWIHACLSAGRLATGETLVQMTCNMPGKRPADILHNGHVARSASPPVYCSAYDDASGCQKALYGAARKQRISIALTDENCGNLYENTLYSLQLPQKRVVDIVWSYCRTCCWGAKLALPTRHSQASRLHVQ